MLKILTTDKEKTTWKGDVSKLTFAYNCTTHSSTGYFSYHYLIRYKPLLLKDFGLLDQRLELDNVILYDQHLA